MQKPTPVAYVRLLLTVLLAAALIAPTAHAATTGGRVFYVDSEQGSDRSAGTSPTAAWHTLTRASSAALQPGDRLLLRRGRTWTSPLELDALGTATDPVEVDAYGDGPKPRLTGGRCLVLAGAHTVVRNLHLDRCQWAGATVAGYHNTIEASLITGNVAGVNVKTGAADNRISNNIIRDNNRMSVATAAPGDDSGAWGVLLRGDRTDVSYNSITGSDAASPDYGRDGAAVEVYGAQGSHVHHNIAVDNNMFSELGHPRSADNVFAYNVVRSKLRGGGFLTTRGAKSRYGPVVGTVVVNNTVYLEGADSQGLVCHAGCTRELLRARNNIIEARKKVGYADAPFDDDHGIYWGARVEFPLGPRSRVVDPRFVNAPAADLRLAAASPGIDSGTPTSYSTDVTGSVVPRDGDADGVAAADRGAYERYP